MIPEEAGAWLAVVILLVAALVSARIAARDGGLVSPFGALTVGTSVYFLVPMAISISAGNSTRNVEPAFLAALGSLVSSVTYLGLRRRRRRRHVSSSTALNAGTFSRRRTLALTAYAFIGLTTAVLFYWAVGGPTRFWSNLNDSGVSTLGLSYLIAGMLFPKAGFIYVWSRNGQRRVPWMLVAYGVFSLILVIATSSRLYLVVFLVQILILFHFLIRRIRVVELVSAMLVLSVAVFVIGEYRISTGPTNERGFDAVVTNLTNPNVIQTRFVSNYFNALQVFADIVELVPSEFDFVNGGTYVRVLLQPIPRSLRPPFDAMPRELNEHFAPAVGFSVVFQYWAEAYLNFGLLGVIAASALLGGALAAVVSRLERLQDLNSRALWSAIAFTSTLILFRGSLNGASALIAEDVVPILFLAIVAADRA